MCYNSSMNEQEFIRRCLKSDKAAWDEFVDKYSRLIYNYIHSVFKVRGINPSADTVSDIFQEIFLNLIKDNFYKLRQFKGKNNATLASWLRVVTINFCLDYFKKKKRDRLSLEEELGDSDRSLKDMLIDKGVSADQLLADRERLQRLSECIDNLSSQDKYFLEMHVYYGVSLKELQATLGVSRSAIDMRKMRIIHKLKECFKSKGFLLDF